MTDRAYDMRFGPDISGDVAAGEYFLTEVIKAPHSGVDPDAPEKPEHASYDGSRLILALGPDGTQDDTYSTIEVSSTRRFDQAILDEHLLAGSPRVVVPGRQAVFRDIVFSPEFADGRAMADTVTTGVIMQSWRGIEEGGIDFAERPEFFVASIAYIGGTGILPKLFSRSLSKRTFFASVIDFRVGLMWTRLLPDFDPSEPHDIAIRWLPTRDVSFVIDGREAALYRDGRVGVWPLKFRNRQFWRGTDFIGHRYVTADPCHIDVWINSSAMGTTPTVPNGNRFGQELSVALAGFGIEPL